MKVSRYSDSRTRLLIQILNYSSLEGFRLEVVETQPSICTAGQFVSIYGCLGLSKRSPGGCVDIFITEREKKSRYENKLSQECCRRVLG